jgi:hypothetical protein
VANEDNIRGLEYMGLAFNLDVTDYPWFSNLDAWLDFAGAAAGTLTDVNVGGERFHGYAYSAGPVDTGPELTLILIVLLEK